MKYNPDIHHRRSIRLRGYDYTSPGTYFITICTHQRQRLFGDITDGEMQLSQFGQLVSAYWKRLPSHFPNLQLDAFVVMPNHLHGILILSPTPRRGAALDQDLLHPTDNLCPNATPNPLHPTDNLCPNATPNLLHPTDNLCPNATPNPLHPTDNFRLNSPSCVPNPVGVEPGVAFGQKVVANGENGLPNAVPLRAGSVGAIILNFKSVTTRRINQMRKVNALPVWQRNYYENIIRDENAGQIIQAYIYNNPLSWQQDQLHPDNPSKW